MQIIKESNRVYIKDVNDKIIAYVTFPNINKGTVVIDHTFVDDSLRGMGVAGKLMQAAYDNIKAQGLWAIPKCSYALKWFLEHEECQDILSSDSY